MKIFDIFNLRRRAANSVAIPNGAVHHIFVDTDGVLKMKKPDGSTVVLVEDSELFRYHGVKVIDVNGSVVFEHPFVSKFIRVEWYYDNVKNNEAVTYELTDENTVTFTIAGASEGDLISIFVEKLGESEESLMQTKPGYANPPLGPVGDPVGGISIKP